MGDANGADKAVQSYLASCRYQNVLIFCSAGDCRNNLGPWEIKAVKPPHNRRDFAFFTAKDASMAEEADIGLMLWDGESSGTIVNAARLIASRKPVVVYFSPNKEFRTLRSNSDLASLLSPCSSEIRQRIDRYVAEHAEGNTQGAFF
jgi:nucleoside 2-deoxyribosyltransferase